MNFSSTGFRALALLVLAMAMFSMDVTSAYAQAAQCRQLESALRQFDRNGDFRQLQNNSQAVRELARQVQNAESQYIRQGCNDDAKAGRTLTPQCQEVGRSVLRLRDQYAQVAQSVETAGAVAQQREAILQEMARFGCNAGSSATFNQDRQSIFDRIFGTTSEGDFTNGDFVDGGDYWGYQGYSTVRTVCVRLSDGYFWPISYSTVSDYIGSDAQQCQAMCPNTPVELYYYDNPGQEPEQMRNMAGSPYTSLPNAFAYRNKFDSAASCRVAPKSDGTVTMADSEDGSSRAMIDIAGVSFPLPLRDPRGVVPVTVAAVEAAAVSTVALVDVPLPRRRPAGPGEIAVQPSASTASAESELRIVHFGDKTVRVVGPDTPYAQAGRAGS
ncbi:MAG: DUF2865 domain-containing protein [Devosia sp.]|uniref:DUF2865 domain-containing protein n=1 Tax=unclassified Devosia TaxID=196773 RepID=UPI001A0A4DD4|nr:MULTISPECIES: DUF2865 domain-containing protein [unclassified Devosia]MBF0678395.1 DUF2865 domain-containing protein [Devosia sp.]WEJ32316.1 DUF2865 domain-containing protein [Devosia sp. SD17-2]